MKSPRNLKHARRNFLLGIAAGTAATAAAVVGSGRKDALPEQDKPGGKKGYQLTEHVRNYYRTARV
jgi:hypothetical protein